MAAKTLPDVSLLRQLLDYDPDVGTLTWKQPPLSYFSSAGKNPSHIAEIWRAKYTGKPALASSTPSGHLRGRVAGCAVLAHRACWALHTGDWPKGLIDHINMNPSDNRFCNLREATKRQNGCNRKPKDGASSRYLGVGWHKRLGRWKAAISVNGKSIYLGSFCREIDAARAYDAAASEFHGDFANLNFPIC